MVGGGGEKKEKKKREKEKPNMYSKTLKWNPKGNYSELKLNDHQNSNNNNNNNSFLS
jgi:hypothetical protein